MLKMLNITKKFKSDFLAQDFTALDNVSFELPEGAMVGYLGANGAGKTTSLKIIMDFIRPDKGEIIFSNSLGRNRNEILKNIGFLPERPYFYPNLTGNEFLDFMGKLSLMTTNDIKSAKKKWAERFKIEHALDRQLKTYSKGMLQRIGFMSTILHNPKLIILDEPISGLDPIGRKELKDVIVEVHKEGRTIFFSSHVVPDVEEICDRVIFIESGKLVYDGEILNLLNSSGTSNFLIKFISEHPEKYVEPGVVVNKYPGYLNSISIPSDQKNNMLSKLIRDNIVVSGVEVVKPTLEEIFYKVKSK